jgi:hypothetical protein
VQISYRGVHVLPVKEWFSPRRIYACETQSKAQARTTADPMAKEIFKIVK